MARIRSIHPGLFTDENYAVLSFAARELLKGLWIESDDNGIFEWKPLSIKMRIFPADAVDITQLLAELSVNWIRQFEADGRQYGACKNFCKYQRPKKPKAIHPLPLEQKPYVMHGYKARPGEISDAEQGDLEDNQPTSSPPVPHQFPTNTEKSGQMEDGGGKMEGGKKITEETIVSSGAYRASNVISIPPKSEDLRSEPDKPAWWPKRDRYGRVVSEITDKILFDTGKAVLGKDAGGQITKLLKCKPYQYDRRAAIELILRADDVAEPRSWFAAALKKAQYDEPELPMHEVFPEQEYRV